MGQHHSKMRGGDPHAKAALQWGCANSGMLCGGGEGTLRHWGVKETRRPPLSRRWQHLRVGRTLPGPPRGHPALFRLAAMAQSHLYYLTARDRERSLGEIICHDTG